MNQANQPADLGAVIQKVNMLEQQLHQVAGAVQQVHAALQDSIGKLASLEARVSGAEAKSVPSANLDASVPQALRVLQRDLETLKGALAAR